MPPPPPPVPPAATEVNIQHVGGMSTFHAHQRELEKLDEILMANDGGAGTEDESVDIGRYKVISHM